MGPNLEHNDETTRLLASDRRLNNLRREEDAESIISSHLSKEEQALSETAVGERLPYNDYTTIDWLHDLVRILNSGSAPANAVCLLRLKIRSASDPFTPARGYGPLFTRLSTPAKDGSRPR